MNFAPIALFAYNRPEHTARLLASLRANPESGSSHLYVFSDGPRTPEDEPLVRQTRQLVPKSGFAHVEVIERPTNIGLAANVTDGVTRLTAEHGRVIVLEDDLRLSSTFLRYMNDALEMYAEEPRVYQVAGFMYPVQLDMQSDALFLPFISSWGWATWARAWAAFDASARGHEQIFRDRASRYKFDLHGDYGFSRMLRDYLAGRNNSWAIRWYLSVFRHKGLALFPRHSLVENHGFGSGATHCQGPAPRHTNSEAHDFHVTRFPSVAVDERAFERVRWVMGADNTFFARASRKLRRVAGSLLRG